MPAKPEPITLTALSSLFASLGNPTRLKIVLHLWSRGLTSVTDLVAVTGGSFSAVSQHLRRLTGEGVVTKQREAQRVLYEVDDEYELIGVLEDVLGVVR